MSERASSVNPTCQTATVCSGRDGFVLVAVLVVVMLLSMLALSVLFRVGAEETATAAGTGADQAWAAAMSGVRTAMRVAAEIEPGNLQWRDDPDTFHEQFVFEDGADRWYFTVYSPSDTPGGEVRYGLTDESSKLNLQIATEEMLLKLPGMTPYLAQSLLDFLDADDTPRDEGAEQEYYDALPLPYLINNGPLSSMGELLLVRGFTGQVLYGEDFNANFQLDPNEDDGDETFPPDNADGELNRGLLPYLTIYSYDLNLDAEGFPRANINNPDEELAPDLLPAEVMDYITLLRTNQVTLNHPAELLEDVRRLRLPDGSEQEVESGVGPEELPLVLDLLTTQDETELRGLINVNTASATVLQTLPEVDVSLAEAIVSGRGFLTEEQRRTPAWLYTQHLVEAATFKKLAPYLTTRSLQYHFHVIGYGLPSGRYRVLEVVIDVGAGKPAIAYLRDITRLGLPFALQTPLELSGG